MEFRDLVLTRQSVRSFKDQDIPNDDILKILEMARLAPSGKNVQNWHFLVIKNKDFIHKLAFVIDKKNAYVSEKMSEKESGKGTGKGTGFRNFSKHFSTFFTKAPVLLMAYTTVYYPSGYKELEFINAPQSELDTIMETNPGMQSLGAAMENITLAALDLGYGTCWMTSQNYVRKEIEALVKEELGFEKEGFFLGCMMPLGVPDGPLKSPNRKPLDQICSFFE